MEAHKKNLRDCTKQPSRRRFPNMLRVDDDEKIIRKKKLALEAIHKSLFRIFNAEQAARRSLRSSLTVPHVSSLSVCLLFFRQLRFSFSFRSFIFRLRIYVISGSQSHFMSKIYDFHSLVTFFLSSFSFSRSSSDSANEMFEFLIFSCLNFMLVS